MVSITSGGRVRQKDSASRVHLAVRLAIFSLVAGAIVLALWLGLPGKLSLVSLRNERAALIAFVHAHPWQSLAAYIAAYIAVVGLSLPGALVMTLTGGFLFGTIEGGVAAVAALSAGSILMFLVAQTAVGDGLREWLRSHSSLMGRMEREVRRHPFINMLTLRLIPAAPLVLVNLAAGFVRIPFAPYALATVLGVMPSTFLYASVGAGLDDLFTTVKPDALMGVIRGELVLPVSGLVCLAAAPLAVRWWMVRRNGGRPAGA